MYIQVGLGPKLWHLPKHFCKKHCKVEIYAFNCGILILLLQSSKGIYFYPKHRGFVEVLLVLRVKSRYQISRHLDSSINYKNVRKISMFFVPSLIAVRQAHHCMRNVLHFSFRVGNELFDTHKISFQFRRNCDKNTTSLNAGRISNIFSKLSPQIVFVPTLVSYQL